MYEELRVCPGCDYNKGFNVSFRKADGPTSIVLICPSCGQSFEIGWTADSIRSFKLEMGDNY